MRVLRYMDSMYQTPGGRRKAYWQVGCVAGALPCPGQSLDGNPPVRAQLLRLVPAPKVAPCPPCRNGIFLIILGAQQTLKLQFRSVQR